nr:hypothetical protein [Tanacetum cinerariifolium]
MANPNLEDPNIPNEHVPEEDIYHLLDFDEKEDPEMDIKEEEPEEDPVEEPEPLAGHGDQFDAHPNPQPGNMNGWVDDHDDVVEEDDDNTYVDIEEDDDAEIIFPYEADDELKVEEAGVEPEAKGADVEFEAEEPDGAPEATIGTGSQRSFAETLGNVVERLKVLESRENVTLKKKLADKKMLLDLTRMDRDRAERRLSESIWWNERFYFEMVRKRAVPKPPSDNEGSERPRKIPKNSDGDEGPSDPRGPLIGAGGSGGASGSSGSGGNAGGGGNAGRTGVRDARPIVPELT